MNISNVAIRGIKALCSSLCGIILELNGKHLLDVICLLKKENKELKERLAEAEENLKLNNYDMEITRYENNFARLVQQSTLPILPLDLAKEHQVDLYMDLDMASDIGGDFYDYFKLNKNSICLVIGDVSGKGISAALFGMIAKTMLKLKSKDGVVLDALCEEATRQLFCSQTTLQHMFATIWIGVMNTQTGELSYVNAGHEPPVIIKSNASISLLTPVSGLPIAAYYNPKSPEKNRYSLHHTKLEPGETLLLYTDGATECRNQGDQALGRDGLLRLINQYYQGTACDAITMKGLLSYLQRSIIQYGNHAERDDDIAFLGLRRL